MFHAAKLTNLYDTCNKNERKIKKEKKQVIKMMIIR